MGPGNAMDFNPRFDFRGDSDGPDPEALSATLLQIESHYESSFMVLIRFSSNKIRKRRILCIDDSPLIE